MMTSTLSCRPRFGTPRNPERQTLGPRVGQVAEMLGKPLMPWQQYVADVALEIDPITGRFVYDEIGLTVPRQSGKSTLILAVAVHRCSAGDFFGGRQRVVYTAQTRNKAREKWEEDYAADLKASRYFSSKIKPHFGNGNEHIRFANGSRFGIEANTEKAGHGGTIDLAFIDEAFAQVDSRLEQAFRPAMITRSNKQLWWVSTAGWLEGSPFLLDKSRRGRDSIELGMSEGLAYFEWSADDDADIDDRDVWSSCMPALGHTITEDAIAGELRAMADNRNDFRRAFLNQWVPKDDEHVDTIVDLDAWAALNHKESQRPSPVAIAVEVPPSRKWANIGLAGFRSDGSRHVQIVESGKGTGWVPDRLAEIAAQWSPVGVAVDPGGPAGALIPAISARGVEVSPMSVREVAQGAGMFVDGVTEGSIFHTGQALLEVSLREARKRPTGGAFVFEARGEADIAPLKAVSLALFMLERERAKPAPKRRSGLVVGLR